MLGGSINNTNFAAVRLLSNGELDPNFGGNDGQNPGTVYIPTFGVYPCNQCFALALQPTDGKIILGGIIGAVTPNYIAAVRLTSEGALDTTFGNQTPTDGTMSLTQTITNGSGIDDQCRSVALQNDGKILLGGFSAAGNTDGGSDYYFAIVRLLASGELDPTFGGQNSLPGTFYLTPTISGGTGDQC